MSENWQRYSALSGTVAIILWGAGLYLYEAIGNRPSGEGTQPAEYLAYYTENSSGIAAASFVFGLGCVLFLWFVAVLVEHLSVGERGGVLPRAAFGSGVALGVLTLALLGPDMTGAVAASEAGSVSPEVAETLFLMSTAFYAPAMFAAALFATTIGLLALKSHALPAVFGWVSLALALLLLVGPFGVAFGLLFGLPLWIIAASLLLLLDRRRPRQVRESGADVAA